MQIQVYKKIDFKDIGDEINYKIQSELFSK